MADNEGDKTLDRLVAQAMAGIRYGAVEITIHDGRVVQIERREKLRPTAAGHDQRALRTS